MKTAADPFAKTRMTASVKHIHAIVGDRPNLDAGIRTAGAADVRAARTAQRAR